MPSTQVKRFLTVVYEEDFVEFENKVNGLLKRGWKHLSSGCNSIPIVGKKDTIIHVVYWMILTKNRRVPIPP